MSCESHVGGSFDFTLSLPSSAPHVQLHSLVVYLRQIVHFDQTYATPCTTDEDLQSRLATLERCTPNLFLLVQETTCVPSSTFPVASPSGCRFHTTGRLPTCNEASASSERLLPSTPFGSRTPLRISHEMVISVDFTSIEENGKRSAKMRVQSVKRCKIASCAAVGEAMVSLPMYEEVEKPVLVEEKPVACACENPLGLVPEREVEEVGAERRGEKVSL